MRASAATNIVTGGLIALIPIYVLVFAAAFWDARRRTPAGITRRLRTSHRQALVKTSFTRPAWNPAKPPQPSNWIRDPGRASYTLEDDGLVHMQFVHRKGRTEHYVGPPVDPPPRRRRKTATLIMTLIAQPAFAGAGFGLAYTLTHGSTQDKLTIGALAAIGGFIFAWALVTTTGLVLHLKTIRRNSPSHR